LSDSLNLPEQQHN